MNCLKYIIHDRYALDNNMKFCFLVMKWLDKRTNSIMSTCGFEQTGLFYRDVSSKTQTGLLYRDVSSKTQNGLLFTIEKQARHHTQPTAHMACLEKLICTSCLHTLTSNCSRGNSDEGPISYFELTYCCLSGHSNQERGPSTFIVEFAHANMHRERERSLFFYGSDCCLSESARPIQTKTVTPSP